MNEISIRPAELDDLQTLLAFEQAIIETERPFDPTIRTGPDVHYYDLKELILSSDAHVVVAESDSQIIASGHARIEESDVYLTHARHSYLGFMYVIPEFRGRGINRKILETLETWSRSRGVTEMQLEVYADNETAFRAYQKSGYSRLILTMRKALQDRSE